MSLYGMMRTSVSGMGAQSNLLSTVGDNIANASTTGYKAADAEFSSVMLQSETDSGGDYQSGSVKTTIRYAISQQGALDYVGKTNTDLAVQGSGFFLVTDTSGQIALTRAGDFRLDASTGDLVNGAGYTLMGYPVDTTGYGSVAALEPVNINNRTVTAQPSTAAAFAANLPLSAATGASYSTSMTAYDALGSERNIGLTFTKTGSGAWEMVVAGDVTGSTTPMTFDTSGNLLTPSPATLTIPVQNSQNATVTTNVTLDFSGMSQKDMGYGVLKTDIDGTPASILSEVSIDTDGTVYAINGEGTRQAIYKIPLANVTSPNNLTPITGNAFVVNQRSGDLMIGVAEEGGLGSVISGATENSTVDTANELTTMIVAQRDYTANSKVFQTGAELLDVLMNLKR